MVGRKNEARIIIITMYWNHFSQPSDLAMMNQRQLLDACVAFSGQPQPSMTQFIEDFGHSKARNGLPRSGQDSNTFEALCASKRAHSRWFSAFFLSRISCQYTVLEQEYSGNFKANTRLRGFSWRTNMRRRHVILEQVVVSRRTLFTPDSQSKRT